MALYALNNLACWFLEWGYLAYYGPEYQYSLQELQADWPWIPISLVLLLVLYFLFAKHRPVRAVLRLAQ